jgi:CheY-like chemotaxis protein
LENVLAISGETRPGHRNIYLELRRLLDVANGSIASPHGQLRPKILLMDDEESILDVTRLLLEKRGFNVVPARDGYEAVDRYIEALEKGEPFAIVIMDLSVPQGMGGLEAIGLIRARNPDVKAIVSSGYAEEAAMADYGSFGFIDMIAKPYSVRDLVALIKKHIG